MRPLNDIAIEIESDKAWTSVRNTGAQLALGHMKQMGVVTDPFYCDPDGYGLASSFLVNSVGWKGPVARRIKKELRVMCGHPRP